MRPLALTLLITLGCSPESSTGTTPPPTTNPGTTTDTTPASGPRGAYWSWGLDRVTVLDPDGSSLTYDAFKYTFFVFAETGFVYVGAPTPTLAEVHCTGPTTDSAGHPACAPFTVKNGQLTIGAQAPVAFSEKGKGYVMGDKDLLPLPSELGAVLEGSYRSYSCLYFSCSTVDITFTANGRFKLDSFRIASSPADGSFWGSTWSGTGSGTVGTYAVGPHSVTLTPDQGNAHTAFLFRDFHLLSATADRLQIGELWFSRR